MSRLMMSAVLGALTVFGVACSSHDDELAAKDKQLQEAHTEMETLTARAAAEQQNTALVQKKNDDAQNKIRELELRNAATTEPKPTVGNPKPKSEPTPKTPRAEKIPDANVHTEHLADGSTVYRLSGSFAAGSSVLTKEGQAAVAKIAGEAKRSSLKVTVNGHTDLTPLTGANKTRYVNNQNLSQARATAVMNALAKDGVPKARMHAVGHGDSQPLEQGTSKEANAKNRRIEVVLH